MPSTAAGRQLGLQVRERLESDAAWQTFTGDQKRWVCPWCLAAIARRPQRSWEDSIGAHLEGCKHYGHGRFQPQPPASVQAQLSFENMVCRAESDSAWQVFDSQGLWICPACLERVSDARLVANQRNTLTFRGMALHLQRCHAYGAGTLNAAPVVRAARDRPAGGGATTRPTSAMALPMRTPSGGAPIQPGRLPARGIGPPQPGGGIPVALPVAPPVAKPKPSEAHPPAAAGPTTSSNLRQRRFLGPGPESEPTSDQPPGGLPGLTWMDAADAEAGAVSVAPEVPRIERSDLMRARDLQQKFLAEAPEVPGFAFATRYEPCDHVSGDFFSFVRLLDGRIGFAIGDVSGHGMQAGLVMSMAKKTLEIYGELVGDPGEVLAKVNDALSGDLAGKMFISITYAILSPSDRTISWARAGHNPTLLIEAATRTISEISPPGMVVGMKAGQVFRDCLQVETTHLRPGDTFLLYTDGVTEMTSSQGEEFGMERLRAVLDRHAGDGPEPLLTQVMDRIRHFRGSKPAGDDVTLVALAVTP